MSDVLKNLFFAYKTIDKNENFFYFYISNINNNEIEIYKVSYIKESNKEISKTVMDLNKWLIKKHKSKIYFYSKEKKAFYKEPYEYSYEYISDKNYLLLKYKDSKNIEKEEKIYLPKNKILLFPFSGDFLFFSIFFDFNNPNYLKNNEKLSFLFFNRFLDVNLKKNNINNFDESKYFDKNNFLNSLIKNNIFCAKIDFNELSFYFMGIAKLYIEKMDLYLFSLDKITINKKDTIFTLNNFKFLGGYYFKINNEEVRYILTELKQLEENLFFDLITKIENFN
ncbi:MAG: hypothetical protein N3A58_07225 [Spirochaetes bacterium]|nr:hypothetical protein [Spirochaetota bacterium]